MSRGKSVSDPGHHPQSGRTLHAWRHPRAEGAAGRCIGRTDLHVNPRRAKRLAHRIRQHARRHGLPRIVVTSPLQRSRAVGRWLARWGWQYRIDAALAEADFGHWDGQRWADIPQAAIDAWCADILEKSPTALAIAKRSFNADSENIRAIGTLGFEALALFYASAESKEGVEAFLQKRKPQFRAPAAKR